MVESISGRDPLEFRKSVQSAPEFTQPYIAHLISGEEQKWPFKEVKLEKSSQDKIVFEANGFGAGGDPMKVTVSYEDPYGLKAKRTVISRLFTEEDCDEYSMQGGKIEYDLGGVRVMFVAETKTPLAASFIYGNAQNFIPEISVTKKDDSLPPLANVVFDPGSQVPIFAEFPFADFDNESIKKVDEREKSNGSKSYKSIYFGWEELTGAIIGIAKFDNSKYPDQLFYYAQRVNINNSEFVRVDEGPYRGKVSRSNSRWGFGSGRLRFSRINSETGEAWMFSVPEWIRKEDFYDDIQNSALMNFFYKYPVVFCLKKRGEEANWFSTHFRKDTAR